ncbi:hypothetical protein PMG11_06468 [Penicillium brasilianum]|uniref:Uncharacterized protein n=1 Tax=Penicillium brasilianum TaxID=104259 RepID=A0A0F7TLX6_PENBI|nr:hypothetical protein PMG11_06468 [Penicillium brasilianum]
MALNWVSSTRNGSEITSGAAAVLRKHIETIHCGQNQYWGLYVVGYEESVAWLYEGPDATKSENEIDEEEEILCKIEELLHRLREVKRRR